MPFTLNVPRLYLLNNYLFNWLIHYSVSQVIGNIWEKNYFTKANNRNVWMCVGVMYMD